MQILRPPMDRASKTGLDDTLFMSLRRSMAEILIIEYLSIYHSESKSGQI